MFKNIKNYAQDYITLAKLEGLEKVGKLVAALVFIVLMLVLSFFFFLMANFALGFYLNEVYGDTVGFAIITGIYLLLILLFLIFRKPLLSAVVNMVIASANNKND
ncbi:hypothetical protein GO491_10355 [Flavobacteriaceae bacterium Ap0902]|nr:hypothetical protein [Flavobacteriaceae bacterium Ap0902]